MLSGSFTLYIDISRKVELPPNTFDAVHECFNVPYINYEKGSYFGDQDTMHDLLAGISKRHYRDSAA